MFSNLERWQSGRMYLTRNQAMGRPIRGFESHPLRQNSIARSCDYSTTPSAALASERKASSEAFAFSAFKLRELKKL